METEPIRVLIVEDHAMMAEGLSAALQTQADLQIAAVATTLREAMAATEREQPDVVVMDYRLPDGEATDCAAEMKEAAPGVGILVITAEPLQLVAAAAIESGCAGLLPKGQSLSEVVRAIRSVHQGESVFAPELLTATLRDQQERSRDVAELTDRELEVLHLLDAGIATREIAEQLVVSVHTVRNHIRNLTAKLGARSRLEALAIARERRLLDRSA